MLLNHLGLGGKMSSMEKVSFESRLISKKEIARKTYEFVFEKPKGFKFNAGQHVRITLLKPAQTDNRGKSRFLTLANTPKENNLKIALRMTDSAFKKTLYNLQKGERVLMQILLQSPHGSFVMHKDSPKPAVFLVGGIGIVPAYAIIKDALERKHTHKIYLFYSNRRIEDAAYLKELELLDRKNSNFKLIATMTDVEQSGIDWRGETGYIDKKILNKYLVDLQNPIYYISGLSGMVNSMKDLLKEIGIKKENIRSEDFSGLKMNLINLSTIKQNMNDYIVFLLFILALVGVFSHADFALSFVDNFNLKNVSYLTAGMIVLIISFKLFVIYKFNKKILI